MTAAETTPNGLPASWRVQLPVFEGPLDLLLHLVRVNRVEITEIPVATICDQFQEYLRLMEELDLDIAAEFVYEAAMLIQLKSRLLLPRPAAAGEGPEDDPRRELVDRLLEYRRLKEAAQTLAEVDRVRQGVWARPATKWDRGSEESDPGLALEEVSLFDLLGALRTVLVRFQQEHPEPILVPQEQFSVRDQLERMLTVLEPGRTFDLLGHLRRLTCRAEAIAAFLAVLELVRLSLVRLYQAADGGIVLFRTTREARAEDLEAIVG